MDPYEQWQSETRRSAFVRVQLVPGWPKYRLLNILQQAARKQRSEATDHLHENQLQLHLEEQKKLDSIRTNEGEQFRVVMERCRTNTTLAERQLQERWKERDRQLWERVEASIKEEEIKLNAAREAERRRREAEEEERRRREERAKEEAEEAQRAKEEAERANEERRKQEVAEKLKKEMEEIDRIERENEAKERKAREVGASALRESSGLLDCGDRWKSGIRILKVSLPRLSPIAC